MEVRELGRISTLRVGSIGNCFVCVINGNPALEAMDELERLEMAFIEEKKAIVSLWIVQGPPGKIDMRIQGRGKKLWDKVGFALKGAGAVITSTGLGAVAVRTFLIGFFLLVPGKVQVRAFSTAGEGLSWLLTLPGQEVNAATTLEWVAAVEAFAHAWAADTGPGARPAASG